MATKTIDAEFHIEREQIPVTALVKAELDTQIATAKAYPRALATFEAKADEMVENHMKLAVRPEDGLGYAIPRGGKIIQGPNARFAEIVAYCWGNLRISRDLISEEGKHVVCEAICHDLETNNAERVRVRRRITNRDGIRYDDDMIGVTANAGASIARRNAVLTVIPKAQWWPLYQKAIKSAGGETKKQVSEHTRKILDYFAKMKINEAQILHVLGIKKVSEINSEHVATLRGIASAIASGETTAHQAFNGEAPKRESKVKEKKVDPEAKITKDQQQTIITLLADLHLYGSDTAKVMKSIGHDGKLADLPAKLFVPLVEGLQKRGRE